MSETTETAANTSTTSTTEQAVDEWEGFDADRAKRTIEALREDLRKAKEDREPQSEKDAKVITGLKKRVEALSSVATEVDQFRTKAQEADEARAETEITLHREKAARTHRLNDEQYEFLSELTDPEAIASRAEKLAAMTTKTDAAVDHTQGVTATTSASPDQDFADFISHQLK